ncbi:MAG: nitroreductase family protein [Eggerthellaceae bacterium]|jgi:nitroreductase
MDFLELATERWTCRKYADRQVEPEKLEAVLEAARLAPTAKNRQPVHVWVVKSAEARARLDEATACLYGAPIALIVGMDPDQAFVRSDGHNYAEIDASIVGTHIVLAAQDQGLASTWVGAFDQPKVQKLFPELSGYDSVHLFAIGYPASDAKPAPRHFERKPKGEFVTEL